MLTAKPIDVFTLGSRQVVVCRLPADINPSDFIDHELIFYTYGKEVGRIQILGVSTASKYEINEYDFSYSGGPILPEQLVEGTVLTNGEYTDAIRMLKEN